MRAPRSQCCFTPNELYPQQLKESKSWGPFWSNQLDKGQITSKANCQDVNSSKKRTNEFIFTTMRRVFARFLEEIEVTKNTFRNYLTFSSANPAHFLRKQAKWAELAVPFGWQLQNILQDFDFFSIAMGAKPSIQLKFIANRAPAFFFMHSNSLIATA